MSRLVIVCLALVALVCLSLVEARQLRQGVMDPGQQPGEGAKCSHQGHAGICRVECAGTKIKGLCPGGAAVQCCLPTVAPAVQPPPHPAPNAHDKCAAKGGRCVDVRTATCASGFQAGLCSGSSNIRCCTGALTVSPAGHVVPAPPAPAPAPHQRVPIHHPNYRFPYKFPYSPSRHIVVDFELQRARLYDGAQAVKEYKISSGLQGVGFKPDFPATPAGKLRIVQKVGSGQPLGEIIEKLTPQKRIGKESDHFAHMQTRILVLDGMDPENKNTRSRSIYLHGTNKESLLGTMRSHGCFRFGNKDIIDLFDSVQVGTEVYAAPYDAWPKTSVVAAPAAAAAHAPVTHA